MATLTVNANPARELGFLADNSEEELDTADSELYPIAEGPERDKVRVEDGRIVYDLNELRRGVLYPVTYRGSDYFLAVDPDTGSVEFYRSE